MIDSTGARCACGSVTAKLPPTALFVIACHCTACQRRSGAPFGAGAYYPRDAVTLTGTMREYARPTDTGSVMRNRFCVTCGSTLCWTIDRRPDLIGVAFGTIDRLDPDTPVQSLFERSRHRWASVETGVRSDAGDPT